ncbi:MAG: response regulator [Bacteriovoracaceae bacterium]
MPLNIVYIDDETELGEIFQSSFEDDETKVHLFADPEKGVEYTKNYPVDFCVIDFRMQQMNGLECREKISKDIPCYLVTGELDFSKENNFIEIISKPIDEEQIESIIKKYRK